MADEIKWTKEVTCELITIYQMYPVLYDPSHKDYLDKIKKAFAFQAILDYLKNIDPLITLDLIKRKLHTLRTQFSKEFRESENSKKSGVNEIYVPKLWCYHQLAFLENFCKIRPPNTEKNNVEQETSASSCSPLNLDSLSTDKICVRKRKRTSSPRSETNRKFAELADMISQKFANKSPYSWLGKQVCFDIDSMQNEQIKRETVWEIQRVLSESVQKDLDLRSDPLKECTDMYP